MAAIYNLSYGLDGDNGKKQRMLVPIPRGTLTLAQVQSFSDAFAALLDETTEAVITDAQVVMQLSLPGGIKTDPVDASDAGVGAALSFAVSGTSYSHSVYLPGILDALKVGEDGVNTDDAGPMAALIAAFVSGLNIGGTIIQPSDRSGADLTSLNGASQSKRK